MLPITGTTLLVVFQGVKLPFHHSPSIYPWLSHSGHVQAAPGGAGIGNGDQNTGMCPIPCWTSRHSQPQAPKIGDRNLLAQEVAVLRNQIQVKGVKKEKKNFEKKEKKKKEVKALSLTLSRDKNTAPPVAAAKTSSRGRGSKGFLRKEPSRLVPACHQFTGCAGFH